MPRWLTWVLVIALAVFSIGLLTGTISVDRNIHFPFIVPITMGLCIGMIYFFVIRPHRRRS